MIWCDYLARRDTVSSDSDSDILCLSGLDFFQFRVCKVVSSVWRLLGLIDQGYHDWVVAFQYYDVRVSHPEYVWRLFQYIDGDGVADPTHASLWSYVSGGVGSLKNATWHCGETQSHLTPAFHCISIPKLTAYIPSANCASRIISARRSFLRA